MLTQYSFRSHLHWALKWFTEELIRTKVLIVLDAKDRLGVV